MTTSSLRTLLRARACALLTTVFFVLATFAGFDARAQAVCAEVKIQIDQKLSLERQGFIAEMRIVNGLDTKSLTDILVNIQFTDRDGNAVVATTNPNNTSPDVRFFYREDLITGIAGGVTGSGTIQPKTTGVAQWLIIPTAGSGGETPAGEVYAVGATLTYKEGGEPRSVTVTPEVITVRPQPLLELDYFLPEDVYGDDPFTTPVEPSEPFTLGVRVSNVGAGPARHVTIESAQPKIVENQQGLLIGFQIDGSYVQDDAQQPTLLLDFGDIDPDRAKIGRWVMSTTLSGRFSEFEASYTHDDEFGGAATSLLQRVTTHTLLKDVYVDQAGRDSVRDFLARDGDTPRLYESDGLDTPVADQSTGASITGVSGGGYRLTFTAVPTATWVKIQDPTGGQIEIGRVERSDGKVMRAENVWKSREKVGNSTTFTHYLNVFDIAGTGSYLINPGSVPAPSSIDGFVYLDADEDGIRDATEQGIGGVVLTLTGVDGAGQPVHHLTASDAGGEYHFGELAAGTYAVHVGIRADTTDGTHTAGSAGGTVAADRIENIVLATGVSATGYGFAKHGVAPPASADLVIEAGFSPIEIELDQTATGTIVVRNAGPDATTASVAWQLPPNAALVSANATVGTVDTVQARWTLPSLAPNATAELQIVVDPSEPGSIVLNASVTGAAQDPVAANNSATATLIVHEPELEQPLVTQEIDPAPRVLALVQCVIDGRVEVACTNLRATRLSAMLAGLGIEHSVVTNTLAYREALRSRRYNVHWISGAVGLLSEQLAEEIRNAVRRGDGLLFEGRFLPSEMASPIAELFGLRDAGDVYDVAESLITEQGVHPGELTLSPVLGSYHIAEFAHTTVEAHFMNSERREDSAVISSRFGDGRTLFHAFDLIDSAATSGSQDWTDFVETSLVWLTSDVQQPIPLKREFLPVLTRIENPLDEPVTVEIGMTFDDITLATAREAFMTGHSAVDPRWSFVLPAGETRTLLTGVRVSETDGAAPRIQTQAIWKKPGGDVELDIEDLEPVPPLTTLARFNAAIDKLNQMVLIHHTQIQLRNAAVQSLTFARDRDYTHSEAIAELISAEQHANDLEGLLQGGVGQPGSSQYVPVADISALVQEIGLRWHQLNPVCGAADTATVTVSPETFWPFADYERLEARGGNPDSREDWEWGLGTHVERYGEPEYMVSIKEFPWQDDVQFEWRVTYLETGEAEFTVIVPPQDDGGAALPIGGIITPGETFTEVFAPREPPGMRSGTAVRLSASLTSRLLPTEIHATIDDVNGMPATAVLDVSTENTRDGATVIYLPAMQSGMSVGGTLRIDYTDQIPYSNQISMQVHAGNVACRPELTP